MPTAAAVITHLTLVPMSGLPSARIRTTSSPKAECITGEVIAAGGGAMGGVHQ